MGTKTKVLSQGMHIQNMRAPSLKFKSYDQGESSGHAGQNNTPPPLRRTHALVMGHTCNKAD